MAATAFEYFVGRKNAACVQLLEKNQDVSEFIAALLDHLAQYADREGISVTDVKLDRPYITSDGYIKARLMR